MVQKKTVGTKIERYEINLYGCKVKWKDKLNTFLFGDNIVSSKSPGTETRSPLRNIILAHRTIFSSLLNLRSFHNKPAWCLGFLLVNSRFPNSLIAAVSSKQLFATVLRRSFWMYGSLTSYNVLQHFQITSNASGIRLCQFKLSVVSVDVIMYKTTNTNRLCLTTQALDHLAIWALREEVANSHLNRGFLIRHRKRWCVKIAQSCRSATNLVQLVQLEYLIPKNHIV